MVRLALPAVSQAFETLRAYGERPAPDAREDVLEACERLLLTMPEASLTGPQRTALAYLADGWDALLMAHFTGMPLRHAQKLCEEALTLLGFSSKSELLRRLGELRAGGKKSDHAAVYETYGLTQREREICTLLLTTGGAQKHIAGQLSLSADTVKFHIKNIYRKLGVQSRAELEAKFQSVAGTR